MYDTGAHACEGLFCQQSQRHSQWYQAPYLNKGVYIFRAKVTVGDEWDYTVGAVVFEISVECAALEKCDPRNRTTESWSWWIRISIERMLPSLFRNTVETDGAYNYDANGRDFGEQRSCVLRMLLPDDTDLVSLRVLFPSKRLQRWIRTVLWILPHGWERIIVALTTGNTNA
jgi:hypothetical protein